MLAGKVLGNVEYPLQTNDNKKGFSMFLCYKQSGTNWLKKSGNNKISR